tara:strand:- start:36362 stop:37126 length:765 start_codon:yes stop_codon:yes gene_type:complete
MHEEIEPPTSEQIKAALQDGWRIRSGHPGSIPELIRTGHKSQAWPTRWLSVECNRNLLHVPHWFRWMREEQAAEVVELVPEPESEKVPNPNGFKNGWASGSMKCRKCHKMFSDVRFRYSCYDKVEGGWPKCCGELTAFCYDWTSEDQVRGFNPVGDVSDMQWIVPDIQPASILSESQTPSAPCQGRSVAPVSRPPVVESVIPERTASLFRERIQSVFRRNVAKSVQKQVETGIKQVARRQRFDRLRRILLQKLK